MEWPSTSMKKKRLVAALTIRQRCGAPDRARNVGNHLAIDEPVSAFAAENHSGGTAAVRRLQCSVLVEADVAEGDRQLVGDIDAVCRVFDQ
jgi:hypothetical protein